MDTKEYNRLKQQVQDKYLKDIKLAEGRRDKGLEAIECVWRMLNEDQEEPTVKITTKGTLTVKKSYGSLTSTVKQALETVGTKFTKNDIMLVIRQISPETEKSIHQGSLAGCLMRLVKQGIIEINKRGKGSTPTLYKKTDKSTELFEKD